MPQLYKRLLREKGFVETRAADLSEAMRKLHSAVCQIDDTKEQRQALSELLSRPVGDVLQEFAKIEELRSNFG